MPPTPASYPVYRSPDGTSEQVAATPAREVQLQFAGWRKVTRPRRKPANAPKPKPAPQPNPATEPEPAGE